MKDHSEYYKMVNGNMELTEAGKKKVSEYILESLESATFSASQPQPIDFSYSIEKSIRDLALANKFDPTEFRKYWDKYGGPTGRFSVPKAPYALRRNDRVDKPKIPVAGMSGFSEQGTPENWDLAIGEVYGYRWWKLRVPARFAGYAEAPEVVLDVKDTRLIGANSKAWDAGRNEAVCTVVGRTSVPSWDDLINGREPYEHEPPEIREACGCGFWAYFDQFLPANTHFPKLGSGKPYRGDGNIVEIPVFGVIKGSGRVIIGEKGFRAQHAEIVGLCLPELAVSQLSWWTTEFQIGPRGRSHDPRSSTMYQALTGGPGWYDTSTDNPFGTETSEAARDEVIGRVAYIEALLSTVYPDAKLMSDQEGLRAYYPPDKNYG